MGKGAWVVTLKKGFHETKENIISLPKKILDHHTNNRILQMRFGQKLVKKVQVRINDTNDEMEVSPTLFDTFGLDSHMKCHLTISDQILRIGPLIAIFVDTKYIYTLLEKQQPSFRSVELEKANGHAKTILIYFSIHDIHFQQRKIRGTYYHPREKRWVQGIFPFPDIIHHRGHILRRPHAKYRAAKKVFQNHPKIKFLNPVHYFDKWDLYKTLFTNHQELRKYLPPTTLYTWPAKLERIMNHHPAVYIKSRISSMGRRVLRLQKENSVGVIYSYYTKRLIRRKVRSVYSADRVIRSFFGKDKLIIQQAIPLFQIDHRNIDMRATLQRDGAGNLKIHSIVVRLGLAMSPITNFRTGSKVYRWEEFFEKHSTLFSTLDIETIKKEVEHFLLTTYQAIEKSYGGPFGEMDIDFALDQKGGIWLIEPNAKPAKDSLYQAYGPQKVEDSFFSLLEYAKYISSFFPHVS